jgi:outer membrane murein-binding lipoprotein Lpp
MARRVRYGPVDPRLGALRPRPDRDERQGDRHPGEGTDPAARRVRHLVVLPGGVEDPAAGASRSGEPNRAPNRERTAGLESEPILEVGRSRVAVEELFQAPVIPIPHEPLSMPADRTASSTEARGSAAVAVQAATDALARQPAEHTSLRVRLKVISRTVTSPKAPGMPFIIFASILVSLAVLGLVVLRVMVDQASFRVDDLNAKVTQQQSQLTQLNYRVSVADAPGAVASQAAALGLVPATTIEPLPTPGVPAQAAGGRGG